MDNVQETNLEPQALDIDDAAEAILGRWNDGDDDLPSEENEELEATEEEIEETDDTSDDDEDASDEDDVEDDEVDPEEQEQEETEDDDETDETEEDEGDEPDFDETLVDVVVNGETKQASIKDLKRLYGQEASLTRKSQEVASKRKEAEIAIAKADASYRTLLERAEARWKPYADLDMLVASRTLSIEDFAALRKEAATAEQDLKFLQEEATAFYEQNQQAYQQQLQTAAKECVEVLSKDIEGWGNDLYNDIRNYAVANGLPQEQVDQYVDPNVIKILNKARLYDAMKTTADKKKTASSVTKNKANKSKVLRSKKAPPSPADVDYNKRRKAQAKLRNNPSQAGDLDDIADALLQRWER